MYHVSSDSYETQNQHYGRGLTKETVKDGKGAQCRWVFDITVILELYGKSKVVSVLPFKKYLSLLLPAGSLAVPCII